MPENPIFSENSSLLSPTELDKISKLFVNNFQTNKIRLTGGEPLARKDFNEILDNFKHEDYASVNFGITTNGLLLHRYFQKLIDTRVTSVNLSIDSLVPEKFAFITRQPKSAAVRVFKNLDDILIPNVDKITLKINVVLMKNFNSDEIVDFCNLCKDHPIEVRFLEYMPFDGNKWSKAKVFTNKEIEKNLFDQGVIRLPPDSINDVARFYKKSGWAGRVGIISTVTSPFCGGCNRIRVTADGQLKNCLFSEGELDLRGILRDEKVLRSEGNLDRILIEKIEENVRSKKFSRDLDTLSSRPMVRIGG